MSNIIDQTKKSLRGLGVFFHQNSTYLFFQSSSDASDTFSLAKSEDGFGFTLDKTELVISRGKGKKQDITATSDFNVSHTGKKLSLFFKQHIDKTWMYVRAESADMKEWKVKGTLPWLHVTGVIVPGYTHDEKHVMYVGGDTIHIAYSDDLESWEYSKTPLVSPRTGYFDDTGIEVEHVMETKKGILLLYHCKETTEETTAYKVGAVLFDKKNPKKILWRSGEALWDTKKEWKNKKVKPLGVIDTDAQLISYWEVTGEGIFAVIYSLYGVSDGLETKSVSLRLKRSHTNPMLSPNGDAWEAFTTFNPAAFYEDGKVHLLYRAQGYDYISTLGYATSKDGVTIDNRHPDPVFSPHESFEVYEEKETKQIAKRYVSGGGYGGCEDPRVTRIDDTLYMTYVAFDGYNPPRVALTSIGVEDFLHQRWLWKKPVLISPPDIVDKNAVIFPEKINGKYVIMHRIYPNILIDYVDDLEFDGKTWLKNEFKIAPRKDKWDSRKLGAGPPPIKTKDGWLLIYQAVGNQDAGRYKIGAMLLDLKDPTKVLHRSNAPILEPQAHYENEGFKSGVVYPCGAVVIDGVLHVYYGGADSHVCVATANLDEFLAELKYSEVSTLNTTAVQKVFDYE